MVWNVYNEMPTGSSTLSSGGAYSNPTEPAMSAIVSWKNAQYLNVKAPEVGAQAREQRQLARSFPFGGMDHTTGDEIDGRRERNQDRIARVPPHVEDVARDQEQHPTSSMRDREERGDHDGEEETEL